ncbi:MAG: hypothetical protein NW224_01085 [Leptolyngbyaceae cyanobacterium bins.302]|nr:hypothetical protein [Leptolyngbyaceae cyanobacterium bins.302]
MAAHPHAEELRTAIQTTGEAAEAQSSRILQSLRAIADQLETWTTPEQPLGNATDLPAEGTVKEISDALNELVDLFDKFENWLEKRNLEKHCWSELLKSLPDAKNKHLTDSMRAKLGAYYRWLKRTEGKEIPRDEELEREEDRLEVSRNIRLLAKCIRSIVDQAER